MADFRSQGRKIWQTLAAIKTGVILLILVVIFSAVGTIVLQRPTTEPEDMQAAYSPQALRILDAIGLTDVFHAWWFLTLMLLVSLSIIAASLDRFPNSWRFYSRPYKYPDAGFRRVLHPQKQLAIPDEESGLVAAERALHKFGFKPERVVKEDHFSIFAERNRISEMAVYIVHASLLLIFFGGIVDGLWGWRGTLNLNEGQTSSQIEMRDGKVKTLPFAIRCDEAGQENYADGTPKKWWSKLAVVDGGRDLLNKQIVVNDPLVYHGVRFYQSSYGPNGKVEKLVLDATSRNAPNASREIAFRPGEAATLDPDTAVQFAEFIPDVAVRDGQVYRRSNQLGEPAIHLVVTTQDRNYDVWLPPIQEVANNDAAPYRFDPKDLKMGHFTGLQVSSEPGQWAVWGGVLVIGLGLAFVFYVVHMRFWVLPLQDAKTGEWFLWIGGNANRNRDAFEQRFNEVAAQFEVELKAIQKTAPAEPIPAAAEA